MTQRSTQYLLHVLIAGLALVAILRCTGTLAG
jgi:hypothetical protein